MDSSCDSFALVSSEEASEVTEDSPWEEASLCWEEEEIAVDSSLEEADDEETTLMSQEARTREVNTSQNKVPFRMRPF